MQRFFPERFSNFLVLMTRPTKQGLMLLADALLLLFAVWAAYSVRLGEWYLPNWSQVLLMAVAPVLAVPIFLRLGLYRSVIRYLGEQALWSVVKAMSLAALLWAALAFMTQMTGLEGVPRAVPLLYWLFGVVLVGGSRFGARWILWFPVRSRFAGRQVLIYGAGNAGRQLADSLRRGRDLFPAGFLDDDVALQGKDMAGLRVYPPDQLLSLTERFDIHDVIVTLPSASSARRREVVAFLKQYPVRVRILPALTDIANGRHLVNMVREVDVGDLLGRDSVAADPTLLGCCITGKAVLVTGAGGSIGSELCRQIAALQPGSLVLLDASEHALYQIHRLLQSVLGCELVPCLGSVGDAGLVSRLLAEHRIATVYHARRVQARADGRGQRPGRGAQQRPRHPDPGQRRVRRRRRNLRPDFHRQGGAPDQHHGSKQALGRACRPGLCPSSCRSRYRPAILRRTLRQRAWLVRFGHPAVQGADRARRSGNGDRRGSDPLLHVHPRSGATGDPNRESRQRRRSLPARHGRAGTHPRPGAQHDPPRGLYRLRRGQSPGRHRNRDRRSAPR
jgi:hypothetical protein